MKREVHPYRSTKGIIINNIILRGHTGYEVIDNQQGHSAKLVIIILYPASPSRI